MPRWLPRLVVLLVLALAPALRANQPGGFTSLVTTSVTTGTVTYRNQTCRYLDNGILRAIISPTGNVQSLRYLKPGLAGTVATIGIEMVSQSGTGTGGFGNHTEIYYYWYPDGTAGTSYHTSTGTADRRSLVYRRPYNAATHKLPMDVELHYTLGRGNTMLYIHAVIDHPSTYPDAALNFVQMIWPIAHGSTDFLCENLYIDDDVKLGLSLGGQRLRRNSLEPTYLDVKQSVTVPGLPGEILRMTSGPFANQLTGKYSYNIAYHRYGAWGRASDVNDVGEWVVVGSHESGNNGPTRREYVHGWGLVYHQPISNHYSNKTVEIPAGTAWTKVLGPWGLYFNGLPDGPAAWADAKAQATAETAAWPYSWVTSTAYHAQARRATLTGRLTLTDPLRPAVSAAGAWVGLAAPDAGTPNASDNWQFQADRYQYWTRAAADGTFTIPDIQTASTYGGAPETFRLYAFSEGDAPGTGSTEEFQLGDYVLTEGETRNIGTRNLTVARTAGPLVWEIGVPDRSAREFRLGDEYATPALWLNYPSLFTNPLEYEVGSASWATTFPFSHTTAFGGVAPWRWNLNFDLTTVQPGTYWLTIAYASADSIQVLRVNDNAVFATFTPPNARPGASSYLRQAVQTKYSTVRIGIPAARLRVGRNFISLDHEVHSDYTTAGFMYDYLSLEEPAPIVLPPGRDLAWRGGASSNTWDRSALNWTAPGTTTPTLAFVDGDRPIFDDTSTASATITLAPPVSLDPAGALQPGRITFANSTARTFTLAGQGVLASPFSMLKTGNGTVTLSPHHQAVVCNLTAGSPVVSVASTTGLFPGLTFTSSTAGTEFAAGTRIQSVDTGALAVTMSAPAATTRTGVTLGFGAAHTYGGGFTMDAGTVTLTNATANVAALGAGPVTLNGGTLTLWDNISTTHQPRWDLVVPIGATARLNASSRMDMLGTLSGGGTLTLWVPYIRTTFAGGWGGFSGRVNVITDTNGGDLRFANTTGCPGGAIDLGPLVQAYGTLSGSQSYPIGELSGSSSARLTGGGTGTTTWVVGARNTDATFAGTVADGTSPALTALNKVGSGTWTLSGTTTHTGGTTVSSGTVVFAGTHGGGPLTIAPDGTARITGRVTLSSPVANDGLLDLQTGSALVTTASLTNRGTLILRGTASVSVTGTLLNQGVLDTLTSSSVLPANLINEGTIIEAGDVNIADLQINAGSPTLSVEGLTGHTYQLQRRDSLLTGTWTAVGSAQAGNTGETLTFADPDTTAVASRFYRIVVDP